MYKLSFNNIFIPRKLKEIEEKEKKRAEMLLQQETINGDLDLSYNKFIKDLGNIKRVEGSLDLENSSIESLGNLKYVGGSLLLQNSQIQSLGNLEYVGGALVSHNTPLQSLGNLKRVEGKLILANTPLQSLGNLKYVGEDLYLQNTLLFKQFPNKNEFRQYIESKVEVKGKIYIFSYFNYFK